MGTEKRGKTEKKGLWRLGEEEKTKRRENPKGVIIGTGKTQNEGLWEQGTGKNPKGDIVETGEKRKNPNEGL